MTDPPSAPVVLVVDDAAVVRRILGMTIHEIPELSRAVIDEADTGTAAVEKLKSRSYDLIVSEIQVRGIDGLALVRHVREEKQDGRTPILLISRLQQEIGWEAGRAVGATAYVPKPLSPHRIKRAIQRLLTPPPAVGALLKRILVVDDDELLRNFTTRILASSGYAAYSAENGAAAIDWLRASLADLVLLDLCMPVVDGWGVLDYVRGMEIRPAVIVVSGVRELVPPGQLGQCISGYLFKPFKTDRLVMTIEDVLSRPPIATGGGQRDTPRRTFIAEAAVYDTAGTQVAAGLLVEVSTGGLRLELENTIEPGGTVTVAFRVPGHPRAIEVPGKVRWSNAATLGAEISTLSGGDDAVLRALVDLD